MSKVSHICRYNTAVKNTRTVGNKTAEFIMWLVREQLSSYDRIHVLGSSLGAQAAGYVGHFTGDNPSCLIILNHLVLKLQFLTFKPLFRWQTISHHWAGPQWSSVLQRGCVWQVWALMSNVIFTHNFRLDRTDAQFVDIIHTAGYWVYFVQCIIFFMIFSLSIQGWNIHSQWPCGHLAQWRQGTSTWMWKKVKYF